MAVLLIILAIVFSGSACLLSSKGKNIGLAVVAVIIAGVIQFLINFWFFPAIGFFYGGIWVTLIVSGIIGGLIGLISEEDDIGYGLVLPVIVLIVFLLVSWFSSSSLFHADDYQQLIGPVETKVFTEDVPIIDTEHIRLVPKETALNLAKKVLGQAKDGKILGSQLSIDEKSTAIQEVEGELWWIMPLDFKGFWEWNNRKIVPGYIRVSAQDPTREAQLIDFDPVTGKEFELRYTLKASFGSRLDRRVYNKYPTIHREEYTFEVDDNWRPYYVISATYPTIGFKGRQTRGVIIADPQTGEISLKTGDEIPGWVDRVKPLSQALEQTEKWGMYAQGYWNTIFTKRDIQKPTSYSGGKDMWFIKMGDKRYWFTGMTSPSSEDQSLVGLMFVDTRATEGGNAIYYSMAGTDENGVVEAVDSALGADSVRWNPAQPIPYNVYGTPTWITTVVSSEGIFQKVSLVHVNNINILVIESNLERAFAKYRILLTQRGNEVAPTGMAVLKRLGPVSVARVGDTVLDGDKTFYIMVEGQNDKLFVSTGEVDDTKLVALVKEGDLVILDFIETEEPIVSLERIQIDGIELKVSSIQAAYDVQREVSKKSEDDVTETREAQIEWDKLSPEEQREAIERYKEEQNK